MSPEATVKAAPDGLVVVGTLDAVEAVVRTAEGPQKGQPVDGLMNATFSSGRGRWRVNLTPTMRTAAGDLDLSAWDALRAPGAIGKRWIVSVAQSIRGGFVNITAIEAREV